MSPENVTIRSATVDDSGVLATLGARTFRDAYRSVTDHEALEEYVVSSFDPDRIGAELDDPACVYLLAVVDDDEAVGYAKLLAGDAPAVVPGSNPVELVRIYVERSVVGTGVGAALMTAALDLALARGHETIWLGVWEQNERARSFYRRWGFRPVGSHTFSFGDERHTDLLMTRPVDDIRSRGRNRRDGRSPAAPYRENEGFDAP